MITHPWGHWLTVDADGLFVDAAGTTFSTLREAFWRSQLRMAEPAGAKMEEQLEFLLSVLVAIAPGDRSAGALEIDLFEGKTLFRDWYSRWLSVEGLVARDDRAGGWSAPDRLTPLGASAMRMLLVSRPHVVTGTSIGEEAIGLLRAMGKVVGPAQARMASVEAMAANMDFAFVRNGRGSDFTIALVRRDAGGDIPLARTIWAVTLPTEAARDGLYGWLCENLDRWGRWCEMAWRYGGHRLSSHLVALLAVDRGNYRTNAADGLFSESN